MSIVVGVVGFGLILFLMQDAFEAILLPRRVSRNFRFARIFYRSAWGPWSGLARRMRSGKRREVFLSYFGPLSMLVLFAIWAVGLILGFGMLQWALGSPLNAPHGSSGFFEYLYLSGVTFFTLGFGDVTPLGLFGRALSVFETGIGFGFLAVVISYLPVLYQAFSQREHMISLFDARAGSPPTAAQLLIRLAPTRDFDTLKRFLEAWEHWSAQLLESHLSFPALAFYRSQHDNQSWLGALTAILDTCSLVISGVRGADHFQARLTFAMARHAVVDLAQILQTPPAPPQPDRLPADGFQRLCTELRAAGIELREEDEMFERLTELRGMYEPFVNVLAQRLLIALPPFLADEGIVDNWQTSAWMRRTSGLGNLAPADFDDHEDF